MKLSPVYFVSADDPYQQRLLISDIRQQVFPGGKTGLNDDVLDGKERGASEIIDLANTLPMLGSQKLIVVTHFKIPKEAEEKQWLDYLENPAPHTVLIVLVDKVDKRKKLFKVLAQKKWLHITVPPKPRELPKWIDQIAARLNAKLTPGAKRALMEAIGPDLSAIARDIEKLVLYVHPSTTISENAVHELVMRTAGDNIFAWSDHIVEGRLARALESLHYLFETGTPPLVLQSMLARHVRILMKARNALEERMPTHQLASTLGVPPFTIQRYMEQAKKLNGSALMHALSEIQELDQALKSTGLPSKTLMEDSIRKICKHTQIAA